MLIHPRQAHNTKQAAYQKADEASDKVHDNSLVRCRTVPILVLFKCLRHTLYWRQVTFNQERKLRT